MNNSRIGWLGVSLLLGCASSDYRKETDANNLGTRISSIKRRAAEFYEGKMSKRLLVEPSRGCFPPAAGEIELCGGNAFVSPYSATAELRMEYFEVSVRDSNPVLSSKLKELAHLVAAELAVQRNFTNFNIPEIQSYGNCSDLYSAHTSGSYVGNSYVGNTYVDKDTICTGRLRTRLSCKLAETVRLDLRLKKSTKQITIYNFLKQFTPRVM